MRTSREQMILVTVQPPALRWEQVRWVQGPTLRPLGGDGESKEKGGEVRRGRIFWP